MDTPKSIRRIEHELALVERSKSWRYTYLLRVLDNSKYGVEIKSAINRKLILRKNKLQHDANAGHIYDNRIQYEICLIKSSKCWRYTYLFRYINDSKYIVKAKKALIPDYYLTNLLTAAKSEVLFKALIFIKHRHSGVFNSSWYSNKYPDVPLSYLPPFLHFIFYGINQKRSPHPLFNCDIYSNFNKESIKAYENPVIHYLLAGCQENVKVHPLFDEKYYISQKSDLGQINPLTDYVLYGERKGLLPHRHFILKDQGSLKKQLRRRNQNAFEYYLSGEWINDPVPKMTLYLSMRANSDAFDR